MIDGRIWKPSHSHFVWRQISGPHNVGSHLTDLECLLGAVRWLEAAQDAMSDGGVSGRYGLEAGWSSSYPETTGYIVPTFLALASEFENKQFEDRARRAIDFLLGLQLADGAFPGLEVAQNTTNPSTFNTAQIIHGLIAWHSATGDNRSLEAAVRAGDWLLSVQDDDGAWRKFFYNSATTTYSAHLTCWLADLGKCTGEDRFLKASERHLDWILPHQDSKTGWIDRAGFDSEQHQSRTATTHAIAYTLWGILHTSHILERDDGIEIARKAARAVARRLELSKWLPGILDAQWKASSNFACLTGNAQMALIWFRLHEMDRDEVLLNAALRAIDLVKEAQPMDSSNPGIRGGVPGSDPVWGEYLYMAIPNWAAKYFVDALLKKREVLKGIDVGPQGNDVGNVPSDVADFPAEDQEQAGSDVRVVLYTSPRSHKVAQMLDTWSEWGFTPHCVVISTQPGPDFWTRLRRKVRQDGILSLLRKLIPVARRVSRVDDVTEDSGIHWPTDTRAICKSKGIPMLEVGNLDDQESLRAIQELAPALAIHAGAGILRRSLLSVPTLGTLNAHMGILPHYRGMNVAEWSYFNGDTVGCTVHLIDAGIDTGDIISVSTVDCGDVSSIKQLRKRVDDAQIEQLGRVVHYVVSTSSLPSTQSQKAEDGVQYFSMHSDICEMVEHTMRKQVGTN